MPRRIRDATTGRRIRDRATGRRLAGACQGCCVAAYIRPRLCEDDALSGDTGAADEGDAIGLQVSALDAAGAFFCFNGRCYYVGAAPEYWDTTAVPGTDFRVVTQGEWEGINQVADCDSCGCFVLSDGTSFSADSTVDFEWTKTTVTHDVVTDEHDGSSADATRTDVDTVTGTAMPFLLSGCGTLLPGITPAPWGATLAGVRTHSGEFVTGSEGDWGTSPVDLPDEPTSSFIRVEIWVEGGVLKGDAAVFGGDFFPLAVPYSVTCGGGSDTQTTVVTDDRTAPDHYTRTITITTTVEISITVNGNTCPCDATLNLFRKLEYAWDCVAGTGTLTPLWQRCMTGAVTHDWQDEADVQCTIRNGRKVKVFTKIENLGACPDPLPALNASLPSPPTVTDCTDCPAGPKCRWRFFAKYAIGASWTAHGSPVFIGCRRTKDFPAWRFYGGSTPDCIFAIDVFAEDCSDSTDCSETPPDAPDLPTGTATDLGAPLCDEVLDNKCWYDIESGYTFLDNPGEEWSPVSYVIGSVTCGGAPGPTDWTFRFVGGCPDAESQVWHKWVQIGAGTCTVGGDPCPTPPDLTGISPPPDGAPPSAC
jgi:hypothetical protein